MKTKNAIIQIPYNRLQILIENSVSEAVKRALNERDVEKKKAKLLDKEFLTINEGCTLLGIKRTAMYDRINTGKITRVYRAGKPYLPTSQFKE